MKRIIPLVMLLLPLWVLAQTAPQTEVDCGETYVVTPVPDEGYHFVRWSDDYPYEERIFTASDDQSFEAIFAPNGKIVVEDGEKVTIDDGITTPPNVIIVEPGGQLNFETSIHLDTLIIEVNSDFTGQVHNIDNIIAASANIDIFMDYRLDPVRDEASPDRWYAFAVPFKVDTHEGITRKEGSPSHVYGTDFLILKYDGAQRAATGRGWQEVQDGDTLYPGNFYLIGIEGTCNHWLFKKAEGTALSNNTSIEVAANPSVNPQNAGINGVANPSLEYMTASGASTYVCFFNNATGQFEDPILLSDTTFAVGMPFFIQTGAGGGKIDFDLPAPPTSNSVARKAARRHNPYIQLTLAREQERTPGRMYISLHDDGINDRYVIGRDFARMDNSNATPHMWCEAYGLLLAAHGIQTPNSETVIPFNISVPENGVYRMEMHAVEMDEYVVELLHLGGHVAYLSFDEQQFIELNKGTMSDYSLRIRRKIPTDIINATSEETCTKVVLDNQLYIRHNGHVYDALGREIK